MKNFNPALAQNSLNDFLSSVKNPSVYQEIFGKRKRFSPSSELGYFYPEFIGMVFVRKIENTQAVTAIGFIKKQTKAVFHYSFKCIEELDDFLCKWSKRLITNQERKQKIKSERKEEETALIENLKKLIPLGSVFVSSWGYEQTNVDYYQVVGYKGKKTLLLKEICKTYLEEKNCAGSCLPLVDDFRNEEILQKQVELRKNQNGGFSARININSFSSAQLKHKENGNYHPDYYSRYY